MLGDVLCRKHFPADTFNLTITSPPYNVGIRYGKKDGDNLSWEDYLKFSVKWLSNVYYWTAPGGRLCVNVLMDNLSHNARRPMSADILNAAFKAGWNFHSTIVWHQEHSGNKTAWGSWRSATAPIMKNSCEVILVLYKGDWKRERTGENTIERDEFMEWIRGIWTFPGGRPAAAGKHPACFPRELARRCIRLFSFTGDKVFDPFAGSGTTLGRSARTRSRSLWYRDRQGLSGTRTGASPRSHYSTGLRGRSFRNLIYRRVSR